MQFHSHADSHVGYQPEIERFLAGTDPDYVNLCLDTGHVAYYGGDCLELITKYPDRIGYVHLKQVNPEIVSLVLDTRPVLPRGGPDGRDDRTAARACPRWDRGWTRWPDSAGTCEGIIEHDLYPCPPDLPLPIAKRTRTYLASCSSARSTWDRMVSDPAGRRPRCRPDGRLPRRTPPAGPRGGVVVVNDFLADKAATLARSRSGARAVADPIAAINDPEVDAVLIASPGAGARGPGQRLPGRRRPGALWEKPLTTDVASAYADRAEGGGARPVAWSRSGSCAASTRSTSRCRS